MGMQMEAMIEELKTVSNVEELTALEDEIAGVLGKGFLKGKYDYSYLQQIKENVEQIEVERRKQIAVETLGAAKHPAHIR